LWSSISIVTTIGKNASSPVQHFILICLLGHPSGKQGRGKKPTKGPGSSNRPNKPPNYGHYSNKEYRALNANQWMKLMQHHEQQEDMSLKGSKKGVPPVQALLM
jgi:hypothetical protein